jgi:DNA-directed RNA polymerase sigma subunit (sigma70/sigma32)
MKKRNQLAERLYKQGQTLRQVGAALGLSHELVRRVLAARGVKLRRPGSYARLA